MPRKKQVTRTITKTICTVSAANKETDRLEYFECIVGGDLTGKKLMQELRKWYEDKPYHYIDIISRRTEKEQRAMSETEYLFYSHPISDKPEDEKECQ